MSDDVCALWTKKAVSPHPRGRASERRFVLSLAQAAPETEGGATRDSEAVRRRPCEIDLSLAAYASRGRPRLASPRAPRLSASFVWGGWVEVLGSANCGVNHRGHYALLLVLPLQKSDGGTKFHWPRYATPARQSSSSSSSSSSLSARPPSPDGNGDLNISRCRPRNSCACELWAPMHGSGPIRSVRVHNFYFVWPRSIFFILARRRVCPVIF